MAVPRFSEILAARRRDLGLSIAQASRVLRLREDVLVAFEEGDFDHMPQSGYAQGMLSSYARYLGLNAREVTDLFQEEVYEYRHGTSSHELRRRTRQTQSGHGLRGYDVVNEEGSRPRAYVEYRPLLPTSGGPAGDMGDFATTAPPRPRGSVPLAGTGGSVAPATSPYRASAADAAGTHEHPYNAPSTHPRAGAPSSARRRTGARRRGSDQSGRLISERQQHVSRERTGSGTSAGRASGRLYLRDDVSTRHVRSGEYTDDMRRDDRVNPYAPASTLSGRRSSRNIAPVERPNVRRRPARGRGGAAGRGRSRGGVVSQFLSDPRRALLAIIVLLAVVLTLILVFSVRSCVDARNQPAAPTTVVPVGTADDSGSDDADSRRDAGSTDDGASGDDASATDDDPDRAADAAGSDDAAAGDSADEEPTETVVEVSVAAGQVSWVEITCDGTSEVADSVTGPWSQSYTVRDSITIQVANPDAVTVTENGERVTLSSRAGGLGTITIEGTPLPEDAEGAEGDAAAGTAGATGGAAAAGTAGATGGAVQTSE